ncbi:MAG: NAD(P)H-dependent oxidoreductase [Flavobacteriia bacterium]|nr:NAD(P)H-dependent oxidoreductase [Flavobacteriia bacterium]
MNYLIIFNHPYKFSFCNAILESVKKGLGVNNNIVDIIHLDNDEFNPVMTANDLKAFREKKPICEKVIDYKLRLEKADHLIFIFPIWWEVMPAMMKGFIDKVIFPGIVYDYSNIENTRMKPLLDKIKSVTVITTMNTPKIFYKWIFGNAIQKVLLRGTFWKLGYKNRKWISFYKVKSVSIKKREKWLKNIEMEFGKK